MKKLNLIIDEPLHRILKLFCCKTDQSITKYIINLIVADLKGRGEL